METFRDAPAQPATDGLANSGMGRAVSSAERRRAVPKSG